jgi:hypothetical protein
MLAQEILNKQDSIEPNSTHQINSTNAKGRIVAALVNPWRREGPPSQCSSTFGIILYAIDLYGFIGSTLFAFVRWYTLQSTHRMWVQTGVGFGKDC